VAQAVDRFEAAATVSFTAATTTPLGGSLVPAPRAVTVDDAKRAAVILFRTPRTPLRCIQNVTLQVLVSRYVGRFPDYLKVYPSAMFPLARAANQKGTWVGPDLLDITPGAQTDVSDKPRRLSFDITELYRTWVSGEAFPSGSSVPRGTAIILELRPPQQGEPLSWSAAVLGSSSSTPPTIAVSHAWDC
jgi:hypothetical protein